MTNCEICAAPIEDSDDALCARCEHGGDRPHLVERGEAAREQKMRFFSRYGD